MTHVAMLWLALLSALTLVSRTPESFVRAGGPRPEAFAATNVVREIASAARLDEARPAAAPDCVLRALRTGVGIRAGRSPADAAQHARQSSSSARHAHASVLARSTLALRRLGTFSHDVAARGSVLPYYSTAPPRIA